MSRCYPYPPPGYVKKANVELAFSAKKEKHKHKDKKKKRRKDSETNGDLPLDPEKRSKKSHQVGVVINEDLGLANGSFRETRATSPEALHEKASQRLPAADGSTAEVLSLARNGGGHEILSKQGHELPVVSRMASACESNGAVTNEATPPSIPKVKLRGEEDLTQYIPRVLKGWSALDDQEWLFHDNNLPPPVPRNEPDESSTPQVWVEAVLLPSVKIFALPYVVPD